MRHIVHAFTGVLLCKLLSASMY